MNDVVEMMIRTSLDEMDKCIDEARKYLLQQQVFNQFIGAFSQNASQLLALVSNPAICIVDKDGNKHYMVGGERWKLFMITTFFCSVDGNEGCKVIKCTNPATNSVDEFCTTKELARRALEEYESVYDLGIQQVMDINDKMSGLVKLQNNSDKLNVLSEVSKMIRESIEGQLDLYKIDKTGN